MITFKQIKWRNFLSTGNTPTEINFLKNKTTLIVGQNGSGKSTLLDAICFVLFNKAFRKINKNQLINSTNGRECVVEVDFEIGTKQYKVIRGIKPNIFNIWIDGVLQNQAAATVDQQKQLEDAILKLNYKSFTQIVILGSASFVPFMQLSTSNRRDVVEDLLDIKIFSAMNSIIKEKIRNNNENIKEFNLSKKMTEEKIIMQKEFIEEIEKNGKKSIEEKNIKIDNLSTQIDRIQGENDKIGESITNSIQPILEDLSGASKKVKKLTDLRGKISQKISLITEQHKFFNNNTICPTCTQNIDDDLRLSKISDYEKQAKEVSTAYDELKRAIKEEEERENKYSDFSRELNSLNNEISKNNIKISQFNKQKGELLQEIQNITKGLQNKSSEKNKLNNLKKELKKIEKEIVKYKEINSYFDFTHVLMKDGGIKAKIIKKYLPLMNAQINKYLHVMDFYINFSLDEEFKESIKSPIHEDFTYESFSEGEKMRINLAILFTWREIARMKNSANTNLLILDEVFDSSLDSMGTDYFTKIINYDLKDSNIFVISHKTDEMIDKFDRVIKFEKLKGFSKMVD